jgi:propionyl-CoA synthetase
VKATDPLYILYTSGTTGIPKGVVRDNGGHLVALSWAMHNVYDINAGEVFWSASDFGWVVGHSFILYGPLAIGATSIIYEGKPVGTPDAGAFWRVISEHGVKALFTAPTAFRAIKKQDPDAKLVADYDLSCLQTLYLAGERVDPDTINWAETHLKIPVIDNWWQTETGWPICANPVGIEMLPVKKGSPALPMPGYDVHILDDDNQPVAAGDTGAIVIKLPLPPGCLPTLWENEDGFQEAYMSDFPGYYKTGDAGYLDADGYLYVMSRTDDIINVAGHRLSTGGMEEVLAAHKDIAECAVLGVKDALKGEIPLGLLVFNDGVNRPEEDILKEAVQLVRDQIGPVAAFKLAIRVTRLPKTRSGKILRATIRKIANGEAWNLPATIDDPAILDEISADLQKIGYPEDPQK